MPRRSGEAGRRRSCSSAARPRSASPRGSRPPASRSSARARTPSTSRRSAGRSRGILDAAGLIAPKNGTATDVDSAVAVAEEIGYPVLVRPSFVLGGRGMEIVYDSPRSLDYFDRVRDRPSSAPAQPLLVDRFLDDAVEIDVDALYDGTELYIGGVMEHIEEAGVHSGDSACTLPPVTLGRDIIERVRRGDDRDCRGNRRARSHQRPVRDRRRRALRPRSEPARIPHGAVRVEGARHPARQGGVAHHGREEHPRARRSRGMLPAAGRIARAARLAGRGQGGGVALQALPDPRGPDRRLRARPGNALDGRGHGHRPRFPSRVRQEPGRRLRRTAASGVVFVSVADRDKRGDHPARSCACSSSASRSWPPRAPPRCWRATASPRGVVAEVSGPGRRRRRAVDRRPDQRGRGRRRRSTRRAAGRARADGYEIRTATVAADKPLFTTIAQLGAAVASLEAARDGFDVTSLQEYAIDRAARLPRDDRPSARGCGAPRSSAAGCASASTRTPRSCATWGLPETAAGAREFGCASSTPRAGRVGIVKPQVAFFERFGSAGYRRSRGGPRRARGRPGSS